LRRVQKKNCEINRQKSYEKERRAADNRSTRTRPRRRRRRRHRRAGQVSSFCVFTRKSETSRSYTSTARVREPPTRRRPTQQRAQASRQAQEGGAGLLFGRPGAPYDGNKRARRRTPNSSSIDHYRHHAHQQIQIGTSPIGLFRWSLGHPLGELFLQLGDL